MSNHNPSPATRFKPGQSGNPGGRPKNKHILTKIDEMFEQDGIHPYTELMKLMPELKPKEQADVWLELLAYCQPKPKPVIEVDEFASMPTDELIDMASKMIANLKAKN